MKVNARVGGPFYTGYKDIGHFIFSFTLSIMKFIVNTELYHLFFLFLCP